jgi:hypothetical protein
MKKLFYAVLAMMAMSSCKEKNNTYQSVFNDPLLYCKTVKKLNDVVMENNFPPMIASRNYTYANIAAYEVLAACNPTAYQSLGGQINGLAPLPPMDTVNVNYQLASLLAFIKIGNAVTFPEGSMMSEYDILKHIADSTGMPEAMIQKSVALADSVAACIMRWSKKDNYAETRSAAKYTVIDTPGRWIPTPPAYMQALEPHWAEIRTIGLDSANQFIPPRPVPFNMTDKNSAYYKEVVALKNTIDSLTDEQKHIAEFWDDLNTRLNVSGHVQFLSKKFSPPGHWMNIVGIAAQKANADFGTTVYAYTLTSICIFDGFIQCWDEKFRSNTVRPETVINKYLDAEWRPFLQTPPFPEYTCGHSTISSAAAEGLTHVFGDHFAYTDTSEMEFGIKNRSFTSFRQAALENNWARYYGGIHFHSSCIISTEYGKKVGQFIIGKLKMKK